MANRNGVDCGRNSATPSGSATTDDGSIQEYLLEAYVMASQPARADSLFTSECVRDAQLLNLPRTVHTTFAPAPAQWVIKTIYLEFRACECDTYRAVRCHPPASTDAATPSRPGTQTVAISRENLLVSQILWTAGRPLVRCR